MRCGDFAAAWALAAADAPRRDPATRDDPRLPYHLRWVWDGAPVEGREVLVRCYHGLGDTLMFARFLPLLAARAATVTVEMQPRLLPLFRGLAGIRLVPFDEAAPLKPHECDLEIMDLSLALRAAPEDAPPPYIKATPAALPEGTVALCWRAGGWDDSRSVPEGLFARLQGHPLVSLVEGPTALPVLNPQGCPMDMPLTARLVAGASLVITVDTMVAHLAGALGRPVWLLLKHDPDWRWPTASERTPWYPTMRIYRQTAPGAWGAIMARVVADLAALR
ncbi:hypothetical protein GI374_16000 [Paracoccus sp. S-4012]|nr:hypothetical protein [Paracoccus sp. S-4012]